MKSTTLAQVELLTPAEVSALLRVPTSTLAVWRCTGRVKLDYVKIGHRVRYVRSFVEQLLAEGLRGHDAE